MVHLYRHASLTMAIVFAVVGLLFVFFSTHVLHFFNAMSAPLGFSAGPEQTSGFFLVLAVSYMYVVSLIAFLMWRQPHNSTLPVLLINGKAGSAILSAALFFCDQPLLIYGANALVDGSIAAGVAILYVRYGKRMQ